MKSLYLYDVPTEPEVTPPVPNEHEVPLVDDDTDGDDNDIDFDGDDDDEDDSD